MLYFFAGLMRTALLITVAAFCSCTNDPSRLPRIDVAAFPPAFRQQVEPLYAAASNNPKDANSVGKLGMMLDAHHQDQTATQCYRRAHALDRGSLRWAYLLGRSQVARDQSAEAVPALREALQIDPNYVPARSTLAEAMLKEGLFEDAAREYTMVLEIDPGRAAAHYGLGRVYGEKGDVQKALEHYHEACRLFPNYGAAHYALALVLRKHGDSAAADLELGAYERNKTVLPPENDPLRREVAELNAGALPHIRRAAELEQAGKLEDAVTEHVQALQIDPKLVQAHVNLISLYGKLGQLSKAEAHFHTSVDLDPKQADAFYNYGVLLFNRKQIGEARQAFHRALEINPHHAQAHHNLGFLFEQQGDLTKALAEYELAASNQAGYRLAHFHAGRILASRKQYNEAIGHLLKSLTPEDDSTPAYLYALAATYARAGNRAEALKFAGRARAGAAAFGQTDLLASIDKDLARLGRP